jgi:hypothetical protein
MTPVHSLQQEQDVVSVRCRALFLEVGPAVMERNWQSNGDAKGLWLKQSIMELFRYGIRRKAIAQGCFFPLEGMSPRFLYDIKIIMETF